jgi:prophage regulatory protein
MQLIGLSRMTIYRLELAGEFPKRRRLSKNSVAWLDTDIAQWAESRPRQSVEGKIGPDAGVRWSGLRLAHRNSRDLVRDGFAEVEGHTPTPPGGAASHTGPCKW